MIGPVALNRRTKKSAYTDKPEIQVGRVNICHSCIVLFIFFQFFTLAGYTVTIKATF
jgi:hypothetical protein